MSFNQTNRVSGERSHGVAPKANEGASEQIENVPTYTPGDAESLRLERKVTITDPVFGDLHEGGPNYRNVGWVGASALMIKTQVGIGVLSIPRAFDILGLAPGIFTLLAVAVITTWSNYIVGQFKRRHPEVYGIDDAAGIMFGPIGKIVIRAIFFLYWVFVSGSAILSLSIGLNAVSGHATCTATFIAVTAIAGLIFASIPTLSKVSALAAGGAIAILISIFTVTIAVAVRNRPADAPQTGPFTSDFKAVAEPTFAELMSAVSMIVFAFSGTPAFFPIAAEMRNPRHYTRSMLICQATVTTVYLVVGVVVYYYCGSYVASPALGSAGPLMKKVCYGIALPGLLVTLMIVSHFPAKMLLVRFLGGSKHLTANTFTHWSVWLSCTSSVVLIAYIIASAVPRFDSLIALIGALLGPPICLVPFGCMWLYMNWTTEREERHLRWWLMACWSVFVIAVGCFIMIGGTYGAVVGLIKDYSGDGGASSWSCADNSNST